MPGRRDILAQLLDYVCDMHYRAECDAADTPDTASASSAVVARRLRFYRAVVRRTAALVAAWQAIGFVHGTVTTRRTDASVAHTFTLFDVRLLCVCVCYICRCA